MSELKMNVNREQCGSCPVRFEGLCRAAFKSERWRKAGIMALGASKVPSTCVNGLGGANAGQLEKQLARSTDYSS